jgi:glutamyl-tRNA synthetase
VHLGNARTALFNLLLARRNGGRFVLRVEDTDTERSRDAYRERLLEDLRWLGFEWDAGPDREDERGPYRQSLRASLYAHYFDQLERAGAVYPCFCSVLELEVSRKAQLAAGRPPRYAGTCRDLSQEQQARRRAQGRAPTLRFRVPPGQRVEFDDLVRGPQSALTDDIGDFIVRRADGTASFFFSNAVDDACMGITHVLRGDDHLANTPRQLLILELLALPPPVYGHVSLLLDRGGAPLSKRQGAASVRAYREQGYLAAAIGNHLFRLGHSTAEHGLLGMPEMARAFDPAHLGRAPAHFDEQQLRAWQKEAVRRLAPDEARRWLSGVLPAHLDERSASAFLEAVLPNVELPADARAWVEVAFGEPPRLDAAAQDHIRDAGPGYFAAAVQCVDTGGHDLKALSSAIRAATGRKGAALYMPLRAALTGRAAGPELAPLLEAMLPGKVRERLARFARE